MPTCLSHTLNVSPCCVRVLLTLSGPLVWLQHQVLFGLFQLLLQTLVLGSDFTDSLLTVLQQTELGTDVHHLLTHGQRTDRYGFCPPLLNRRSVLWNTCGPPSAAACLTFTQLHTFTPHRLSAWPQSRTSGYWAASLEQWGVKWLSYGRCRENLYFMVSLSPSFPMLTMLPPLNM